MRSTSAAGTVRPLAPLFFSTVKSGMNRRSPSNWTFSSIVVSNSFGHAPRNEYDASNTSRWCNAVPSGLT